MGIVKCFHHGSVEQTKLLIKEGCIPPFVALLKDEVNDIVIRGLIGLEQVSRLACSDRLCNYFSSNTFLPLSSFSFSRCYTAERKKFLWLSMRLKLMKRSKVYKSMPMVSMFVYIN